MSPELSTTYRDHYPLSCIVGVKKKFCHIFSGTMQASFLIFGTEHQYGELYRERQFLISRLSTSYLLELGMRNTQVAQKIVCPGRLTTKLIYEISYVF